MSNTATVEPEDKFFGKYFESLVKKCEALKGRLLLDIELEKLKAFCLGRLVDRPAKIENNYNGKSLKTSLKQIANFILKRKHTPIITGHGTLFRPHEEFHSVVCDMVKMLMEQRKVEKDEMFRLMDKCGMSSNHPEVEARDQNQKIFKLLANSYYGAMGEQSFHFFNHAMGPAVTYTGQLIIAYTLYTFECLMAHNLWLKSKHEFSSYLATILSKDDSTVFREYGITAEAMGLTDEKLIKHLAKACAPGWKSRAAITSFVNSASPEQKLSVFARGNLEALLSVPALHEQMKIALSEQITVADGKKMSKECPTTKLALDRVFGVILKVGSPEYIPGDLPRRVATMRRSSVILTDTDSTFVNFVKWMGFIEQSHPGIDLENDTTALTALNTIIYMLRLFNDVQMAKLTEALNVPENQRHLINFKSEFVIKRMVLTNGKKNYVALQQFQEGVLLAGGKVEVKGLSMKKTGTPRSTGRYLEGVVENHVLRSPVIDRKAVIGSIVELEDKIRTTVKERSTTYFPPVTFSRFGLYDDPYSQPQVRGLIAWNCIEIQTPIRENSRVLTCRLKPGSDLNAIQTLQQEYPQFADIYSKLASEFFESKQSNSNSPNPLAANGLNWISIPQGTARFPEWIVPLLDPEYLIDANTRPILPITESIGITTLSRGAVETYSTVISL